jgi:carbamoyltransferase
MSVRAESHRAPAPSEVNILGISCFYHDSAACLVRDGRIVAAAQEERFTREKHDAGFPKHAIAYCLREGGLSVGQVDYVAFYEKPFLKFDRLLHSYLAYAPAGLSSFLKAIPLWIKEKIWMKDVIREELAGYQGKILFPEHHEAHAASAFFPSPFREAAILTVDGVGEWTTTSFGIGQDNRVELHGELHFPHSLGLLYSAFTYYTGFKVNSGEYKLMGLAPYGEPTYKDVILRELIDLKEDGSFKLNMRYFNYGVGLTMTNERFERLFGGPPRQPEGRLTQRDMDVARSIQAVTEEIMCRMARHVRKQTGLKQLVLAGGVALNCVANGCILRQGIFEDLWIQPAAGDAGGALGAALLAWHHYLERPRRVDGVHDAQQASLLGPRFEKEEIRRFLASRRIRFEELGEEELTERVAGLMAEEKIIGWFYGRMEFGPRALGARSILGDARSGRMQAAMNLKIKFRESFRPFAPCVLRERVHEWFGLRPNEDSPYMLLVAPVLEKHRTPQSMAEQKRLRKEGDLVRWVNVSRSSVPAITHVDYSARVQTVDERHGRYRRLLERFHAKTGCPVIVNTSFNLSWEPIVCTPEEAYATFMQSEMDALVLEDFLLLKADQPVGFRAWADADPTAQPASDSPWADPRTGEALVVTPSGAVNPVTGTKYPVEAGIPRLFVPTEDSEGDGANVTELVKQFYEKTPFPNYDDVDNVRALLEKAGRGLFARLLNEQIPYDARVVEIGCGTGQLTNFLSIAHRSVLGTDMCLNSLKLAQGFKEAHGLERAVFAQMNLFRPALRDGFFDFVISNGVLHDTHDPRAAFGRIARLARPGGFVLVGLCNAYSRRVHYARRALFRWRGLTSRWLDPRFARGLAAGKREAWFQDQYCHPRESRHTLDEVLGWLAENGLEFVNAIPKPAGGLPLQPSERLFEPKDRGTRLSRRWSQLRSLGSGYQEGGFLIVIARRR